jgi:ankyrin repeat protein
MHAFCDGGCVQNGRTPLSYAAERGQASICRLLLEKEADVNDADNENRYFEVTLLYLFQVLNIVCRHEIVNYSLRASA